MSVQRLWYVKRGDDFKGPFPAAMVEDDIALGRIIESDQLSQDLQSWQPAHEYPKFADLNVRRAALLYQRRIDQRQAERRRSALKPLIETRARSDRRQTEADEIVRLRAKSRFVWLGLMPPRLTWRKVIVGAVITFILFCIGAQLLRQTRSARVVDCHARAAPNVVWDACDLRATNLHGVDLSHASMRGVSLRNVDLRSVRLFNANLSYADLSATNLAGVDLRNADLTGANLQRANLVGANLTAANLEFSDLRHAALSDAVLVRARLNQALWQTGMTCSRDSLGVCLIEKP